MRMLSSDLVKEGSKPAQSGTRIGVGSFSPENFSALMIWLGMLQSVSSQAQWGKRICGPYIFIPHLRGLTVSKLVPSCAVREA